MLNVVCAGCNPTAIFKRFADLAQCSNQRFVKAFIP